MNFAKQIAQLKARMTEQGAQLLINAESVGANFQPQASPNIHMNSGVLKKRTYANGSSARLEPLDNSTSKIYTSTIQNESSQYSHYDNSGSRGRNSMVQIP